MQKKPDDSESRPVESMDPNADENRAFGPKNRVEELLVFQETVHRIAHGHADVHVNA